MGFFTLATEWGSEEEDIFRRYKDGMWAEYCRLPATNVERLEPTDDVDKFSLVSQIAVGYRALKRARFGAGETVIVNGASGITGTGAVLAALAMGAGQVIAIAHERGVPILVDASNTLPPAEHLYSFIDQGADLVGFSGGKGLRQILA